MNRNLRKIIATSLVLSLAGQPVMAGLLCPTEVFSHTIICQVSTETRFQQEALAPAARWARMLIPAFSALGLHLIFTHTHLPAWLGMQHVGHTLLGAALFFGPAQNDENNDEIKIPWLIGQGHYGERFIADDDVHLLTPHDEAIQLIDLLLPKADGDVKTQLQTERTRLEHLPLSSDELTQTISELRKQYFKKYLEENPEKRERWSQTFPAIEAQLTRIQDHWGLDFRNQVERMILELETVLPLTDDKLNNFQRYIEEPEHGLLHSLIVIDEAMRLASITFEGRANFDDLMREARIVLPGIGLYHDLTGMRERDKHHETADALARRILSQIRTPEGTPQYTEDEINQIALGCLRHRGDAGYPQAVSELEKIFKDVDEYILVTDIARIIRQGIKKGAFQHRKWDIYRRYVIDGGRSFNQRDSADEGSSTRKLIEFYQENPSADYFQYLFYTQMRRTNPDNYDTPAAKAYVSSEYYRIKPFVAQEMEALIRKDVLGRDGFIWEINNSLMRMNGITTEMEAIYRGDKDAQETLRKEIGTTGELAERLTDWYTQSRPDREHKWLPGATEEARHLLAHMDKTISKNGDFNRGLALFAGFLENPDIDLDTAFGPHEGNPPNPYLLTGFADGIYRVVRDRVQDLFKMVQSDPQEKIPDALDVEMGQALAQWFLFEVNQGKKPQDTLDDIREILDSFRYGTKLPGTWDAPAKNSLSLLQWIRSHVTAETHIHTSPALKRERVAQFYAENPHLIPKFHEKFPDMDPTNPHQLKLLGYGTKTIENEEDFERAFTSAKIVLANDPDLSLTRQWYAQIIEDAARDGNRIVAITSTFDAQINDPDDFHRAVIAAIDGIKQGEENSRGKSTGLLIFGLRKKYTSTQMMHYMRMWLNLRDQLPQADRWRLFGVDSVGYEEDDFNIIDHLEAFLLARYEGQWAKMHAGEMWSKGNYLKALIRSERAVKSRIFHEVVNMIALFVNIDRASPLVYSAQQKYEMKARLRELVAAMRGNPYEKEPLNIGNISITSNAVHSRRSFQREGWTYVPLGKRIQQGLIFIVTGDDHGILDTETSHEYYNAYVGESPYGSLSFHQLANLLKNSEALTHRILRWIQRNGAKVTLSVMLAAGFAFNANANPALKSAA